ncbi:Transcription factor [Penicillium capsulatum]|uniref:Transcription factor n=1 Tax=Penicillium capsulatum TaxID=69766 RepID=A0A9W9ISE5_9EURO|nr:Transcription factor [Penicillium capsulatum]KAJ6129150.1 Transcription factor [Penicillium capsulatum]
MEDVISFFGPPFGLWLSLTANLSKVLQLYRPIGENDDHVINLPTFEELVEEANAWDMPQWIFESLELVYEAVVILSSHSTHLQGRTRSTTSIIRQERSVFCIASLIRSQDIRSLLPLPMTTYAISLAFSVTYKQLKEAKLSSTRRMADEHLQLFLSTLRVLSPTWWSAAVMARLGMRALESIRLELNDQNQTRDGLRQCESRYSTVGSVLSQHTSTLPDLPRSEAIQIDENALTRGTPTVDYFPSDPAVPDEAIRDFGSYFDSLLDVNFATSQFMTGLDIAE